MSESSPDQTTVGQRIIDGLQEAVRHARGEPTEVRVTHYIVRRGVRLRPDGVPQIFREAVRVQNAD
jgi:hypothetical protein